MLKVNPIYVYVAMLILLMITGTYFFAFSQNSLLYFDVAHYETIKNKGYFGIEVAFFPLFPLVWKLSGLSALGISILNGIVYFSAVFLLFKHLNWTVKEKIICLLTPGLIFFIVPYTEAFFFVASTILVIGINKKQLYQIIIGLLLCAVCRPSFTVLLPALILMEFFSTEGDRWKRILIYILTTVIGGGLVAIIQYSYTGKWFEYLSVQSVWDNSLRIPSLPLRSWGSQSTIMLDGVALLVGSVAGVSFLIALIQKRLKSMTMIVRLSLAYLAGMTLIVVLFRGGSLFSLNRFVFCSPFFFIAVSYYLKHLRINTKTIIVSFFLLICYWLLFNSFVHIQTFLKYGGLSIALLLPLLAVHKNQHVRSWSLPFFVSMLFLVQLYFCYKYLIGDWVG